jgi:hypothetical protein
LCKVLLWNKLALNISGSPSEYKNITKPQDARREEKGREGKGREREPHTNCLKHARV